MFCVFETWDESIDWLRQVQAAFVTKMQKNKLYATDANPYACLVDFVLHTKLQRLGGRIYPTWRSQSLDIRLAQLV